MRQITEKEAKKYIPCTSSNDRITKLGNWETTVAFFTLIPSKDPRYANFDDVKYYTNKLK
jgi:hypothetical protein